MLLLEVEILFEAQHLSTKASRAYEKAKISMLLIDALEFHTNADMDLENAFNIKSLLIAKLYLNICEHPGRLKHTRF